MKGEPAALLTNEERIGLYLAAIPGAVSGSGGHNQTFSVACSLYNGWALSENETLAWLKIYNERCDPKWSDRELAHKAADAAKAKHNNPRGHLIGEQQKTEEQPSAAGSRSDQPIVSGKLSTTLTTLQNHLHTSSSFSRDLSLSRKSNVVNVVKTLNREANPPSLDDSEDVTRFLEEVVSRKKGAIVAFHYLLARYRTWRKGYGLLKTDFDETAFALAVQSHGIATNLQRKLFFDVCTQQYRDD